MWEWREDTATSERRGAWRLDPYGTWVWDVRNVTDADPRATRDAGRVERLRPAMAALTSLPALPEPARRGGLVSVGAPPPRGYDDWEPTPIFSSVASDRERDRDRRLRLVADDAARRTIPEPHPGSGPLPVQRPEEHADRHPQGRRRLAPVETVPPPPLEDVPAESPQDELRRRAERRRRPRGSGERAEGAGGRHAMRAMPDDDRGRHAFR